MLSFDDILRFADLAPDEEDRAASDGILAVLEAAGSRRTDPTDDPAGTPAPRR